MVENARHIGVHASGFGKFVDWLPEKAIDFMPDHHVEQLFINRQYSELSIRDPGKYDKRSLTLFLLSNFNPLSRVFHFIPSTGAGIFPALEVSYHWGRAVDDVVDGDAPVPHEGVSVPEWLSSLKELAITGAPFVPRAPTVEFMLQRTLRRLERMNSDVDIQAEMVVFLDAMAVEYHRRVNRQVLTGSELEKLNKDSFGAPHTITLVAVRSKAVGSDIWELGQIQGRIQALRDMEVELPLGICNIPAEVLEISAVTYPELAAEPVLFTQNTVLQEWKQEEIVECRGLMECLGNRDLDTPARLYVKYFLHEIDGNIENLLKQ